MLRRAENCRLDYRQPVFASSKGKLTFHVGAKWWALGKMERAKWDQVLQAQQLRPMPVLRIGERQYWQFRHRFYWDNDGLSSDQVYALLVTRLQREQATIDRAQAMVATGMRPQPTVRGAIPDDVKQLVWNRDGGRCRHCGSGAELQYDHVIPVALGGASTPENLQVLCGPCNRRKGAGLTTA
jgi:hypothetical protein